MMRTVRPLASSLLIVLTAALPLAAQTANERSPDGGQPAALGDAAVSGAAATNDRAAALRASEEAELAVESRCDRHQRVRPCREADGSDGFQCVATSPLAAVLHWLEKDDDPASQFGDEVRVEVRRDVVGGADEIRAEVHREVRASRAASVSSGAEPQGADGGAEPLLARRPRRDRPLCRRTASPALPPATP